MRPQSIIMFERLYLGAWGIGVINSLLAWNRSQEALQANPVLADIGPGLLYVTTAIGFAIPLLLWYFIARRRSVVAKWLLVVLFAIGLMGVAYAATQGSIAGGISGALAIVALLLQAGAVYMLFRPDTRAWFGEGATE